jgi:hypothetical protein
MAEPSDDAVVQRVRDAAARALAEAEARRAAQEAREAELAAQPEFHGRDGPEPVRYGDWEVRGIASDF